MVEQNWWEAPIEVIRVEALLVRAGVLPDDERAYYRGKPYKWSHERESCDRLEAVMRECGVDPTEGWDMSCSEVVGYASRQAHVAGGLHGRR